MADLLYGFHRIADRVDQLAADPRNIQIVNEAVDASLDEHNRTTNELLNRLSLVTTDYLKLYKTGARSGSLQPIDEYGRAVPRRKPAGTEYSVGLPLLGGADAVAGTYRARQKRTVQDINDTIDDMTNSDLNWLRFEFLSAFLADAPYTFTDEEHGALLVKPLANGDTDQYLVNSVAGAATDNHLKAIAGTISDVNNPFTAIRKELLEHPENGGAVVSFVSDDLMPAVEALAGYTEFVDSNITSSITVDRLTGAAPAVPFGEIRGYLRGARVWIARYDGLNEVGVGDYMISLPTVGPAPLAMRQDPETNLQGFFRRAIREDHPYWEAQYDRYAGFGAWNRVGAVITRVGNATYAVPTGYSRSN